MSTLSTPRLAALAARPPAPAVPPVERCELCAQPLPSGHRHILDTSKGEPLCACPACAVLFDGQTAGARHYRLIPRRRLQLADFRLDEQLWAGLGIPVDLVFIATEPSTGEAVARYPSPAGALRAPIPADSWIRMVNANPVLADLQDGIEALVIDQSRGATERWILPLDDCYRLTAILREHWTGFSGGPHVRTHIADFFDHLREEQR